MGTILRAGEEAEGLAAQQGVPAAQVEREFFSTARPTSLLQRFATPEEVREKVATTCEILGASGGYIMSGTHHIQADVPLENILAMYDAV